MFSPAVCHQKSGAKRRSEGKLNFSSKLVFLKGEKKIKKSMQASTFHTFQKGRQKMARFKSKLGEKSTYVALLNLRKTVSLTLRNSVRIP